MSFFLIGWHFTWYIVTPFIIILKPPLLLNVGFIRKASTYKFSVTSMFIVLSYFDFCQLHFISSTIWTRTWWKRLWTILKSCAFTFTSSDVFRTCSMINIDFSNSKQLKRTKTKLEEEKNRLEQNMQLHLQRSRNTTTTRSRTTTSNQGIKS